jgi:hypothetical protein
MSTSARTSSGPVHVAAMSTTLRPMGLRAMILNAAAMGISLTHWVALPAYGAPELFSG